MTNLISRQIFKISLSSFRNKSLLTCYVRSISNDLRIVTISKRCHVLSSSSRLDLHPVENFDSSERLFKRNCLAHKNLVGSTFSTCSTSYAGSSPKNDRTDPSVCNTKSDDKIGAPDTPKLSLYQRFKQMYKEYWYVLVPVHVATSIVWFGGFYYLAVSGVDVVHLLEVIGLPQAWIDPVKNSKATGLVAAYTLYKIATPARYTVTLGGTTLSINYLKQWGWIKPMPNREKLKEMYEERKEALQNMKDTYQDKIKTGIQRSVDETKDEIRKTTSEVKQQFINAKEGLQRSKLETKRDMEDFKEGVQQSVHEWKHVGNLFRNAAVGHIKEQFKTRKKQNE